MEIKSLNENTMIAEACCGEGDLSKKSELTEHEHNRLRAAEIKAAWFKKMIPKGLSAKIAYEGEEGIINKCRRLI